MGGENKPLGALQLLQFHGNHAVIMRGMVYFSRVFPAYKENCTTFPNFSERLLMSCCFFLSFFFFFQKKRLCHKCFPVNFAKFLRTPFLKNTSGRLLLFFQWVVLPKPRNMKVLSIQPIIVGTSANLKQNRAERARTFLWKQKKQFFEIALLY